MMRLWLESYAKTNPLGMSPSAVLSVLAHAGIIAVSVTATQKAPGVPEDSIANRVYYIPPPDRSARQEGTRETLRYFELAPEGQGIGLGVAQVEVKREFTEIDESFPGDQGTELQTVAPAPDVDGADSVLSVLEVDSAAVRDPESAAPAYPLSLLKQNVQGSVSTQYVVDTTGFADTASLKILRSSHADFTMAVRSALPYMRFTPARLGPRKVRQLVEQEFTFRIQQAAAADTTKKGSRPIP